MNEFTAVVLLAGYGSRISSVTDDPKCLLPVGGRSILHRHLEAFKRVGIRRVVLVIGYRKQKLIDAALPFQADLDIKFVANDDFETKGNTWSLFMGIEAAKGPVLIFDGDLVYSPDILRRFIDGAHESSVVVGTAGLDDIECTKALVDERNHVRMTVDKRAVTDEELARYRFVGEAFGILKFSNEHRLALLNLGREFLAEKANWLLNWEHLLARFFPHHDIWCDFEESTDWVEIDTPEDYEQAQQKSLD